MARQIRKYADKVSLKRYITNIEGLIDGKSDIDHTHQYINGKKIVVSSTVPTVNDENIITLYVSDEPSVEALTLSEVKVATRYVGEDTVYYTPGDEITLNGAESPTVWVEFSFNRPLTDEELDYTVMFSDVYYRDHTDPTGSLNLWITSSKALRELQSGNNEYETDAQTYYSVSMKRDENKGAHDFALGITGTNISGTDSVAVFTITFTYSA